MKRARTFLMLLASCIGGCATHGGAADLGALDAAVCVAPLMQCGADCIDVQSAMAHCGACDSSCGTAEQCVSGHCTSDSTGGLTLLSCGPDAGYENGATWVTIMGTGFQNPLRAFVGDARAPAYALDSTHGRMLTPPGPKGTSAVRVEVGANHASLPNGFRYDTFGLAAEWAKVMMSQARGSHPGLTVLQNGRVLIFGGTSDSTAASALNTADLYNPTTKTTELVASTMATARFETTATTLLDGRVLIVGACNLPSGSPSCPVSDGTISDLFDPATNTFMTNPPKLADPSRFAPKPTLLTDGRVLITSPYNPTAEVFDPATSSFTMLSVMSVNAGFGIPVRLRDGRVLLVAAPGGRAELYDPETNIVQALAATFTHAPQTVHVLPDGRAISAGGGDLIGDNLTPHGSIEVFNPVGQSFAVLGVQLMTPRTAFASVLTSDGSIVIAGGQTSTYGLSTTGCDHVFPLSNSVEVVNPTTNLRSTLAPLPESNFELRGVSLFDGSMILAGGSQCGGAPSIPFVYFLKSAPIL